MQNVREYSNDELVALVPLPADDANKYSRGTLAAIVGSERYPGAACLAAYAGQRMGAGYTEVFTRARLSRRTFRPRSPANRAPTSSAAASTQKTSKPRSSFTSC